MLSGKKKKEKIMEGKELIHQLGKKKIKKKGWNRV